MPRTAFVTMRSGIFEMGMLLCARMLGGMIPVFAVRRVDPVKIIRAKE